MGAHGLVFLRGPVGVRAGCAERMRSEGGLTLWTRAFGCTVCAAWLRGSGLEMRVAVGSLEMGGSDLISARYWYCYRVPPLVA
eukprot:2170683-Prymnesium_polylepis.1